MESSSFETAIESLNNYEINDPIPFFLNTGFYFQTLKSMEIIERAKTKPKLFVASVKNQTIENESYSFLHKTGDDLRKDQIVLQAIILIKQVSFLF